MRQTPLDYLSRHPLSQKGDDKTEKIIRWNLNAEHAVIVTRITEETQKDEVMQWLAKRIAKGDWEKHKRDKGLETYLHINQELSVAEWIIHREHRIVLPPAVGTKIDYLDPENQTNVKDDIINQRDAEYRQKMKQKREASNTVINTIEVLEVNEGTQPPQIVLDLEIPEKGT